MALSKRKKKNMVTLLGLCAVLVLLIVVYFAASKWKGKPEEKESDADPGVQLAAVATADIAEIKIESDLYSYTVAAKENQWVLKEDEEFPLATGLIDTMAEKLGNFETTKLVLAGASDLSEYGLSDPVLKLIVTKKDQEKITLCLGDLSSADGGYYVCVEGSSDVYLVDAEVRNAFYFSEHELIQLDTVPTFTAESAAGLKVVSDTYDSFTIKDSTNDLKDLTAMALYTLALYDKYEVPVRVDLTNFATMMEPYTAIKLGEIVAYHAADAATYGLSEPKTALTVWYEETDGEEKNKKEFTLYFGDFTEEKSEVYVRKEGSNQIFKMAAETANTLLAPDTFTAISRYTQMVNITSIGGLTLQYDNTERVFTITHETQTLENGSTTTDDYFTVDGKELNEEESELFRDLYQVIIGLQIKAELAESAELGENAVLSLTFYENGSTEAMHTVRYLPIVGNKEYYAIEENGVCLFMAEAAQVDEALRQIKEYQP